MRIRNAPGRRSDIWLKLAAELRDAELLAILLVPWLAADARCISPGKPCRSRVRPAGVARLEAARELVLRQFRAELQKDHSVGLSRGKKRYLQARYGGDPHESFVCVYLNNEHYVVNIEVLFRDTIDGAPVYPREVVKRCLYFNAAAVIFAHNQPSSVAEPSEADITVTRRLQAALNTVDIRVLDHLVLAEQNVVSLAERRSMV